jgi:hypothetical protein
MKLRVYSIFPLDQAIALIDSVVRQKVRTQQLVLLAIS